MTQTSSAQRFLSTLEPARQRLDRQQGPEWVRELRQAGRQRFEKLGIPTPRDEKWRNTNLAPLTATAFGLPDTPAPAPETGSLTGLAALELGPTRLVFVDGQFTAAASTVGTLPQGVWVGRLADALVQIPEQLRAHLAGQPEASPFPSLNDAFLEDGPVILVPDGVELEQPIQILHLSGFGGESTVSHPRTLIAIGHAGRAQLVEIFSGNDGQSYFTNAVNQIILGDRANVDYIGVQSESEKAYHVGSIRTCQGRDSRLAAATIDLGGRLVRHDLHATLDGEGGECSLIGLYATHATQHIDHNTTLDHAKPHCSSRELYKGILDDRSRTVFCGRIVVREDAQKTDAKQSNPNLLLSTEALAHTRPQLEIYADDVRCTHGATVGQLDREALFYLRSRGIDAHEAYKLLIHAFAGEVLEQITIGPLREELERRIAGRLDRRQEGAR